MSGNLENILLTAGTTQPKFLIPETRGLLFELDPATSRKKLRELLEELQQRGFNLLIIDAISDGYAHYESAVMRRNGFPAIHPNYQFSPNLFLRLIQLADKLGFKIYLRANLLKLTGGGLRQLHPILRKKSSREWGVCDISGKLKIDHTPNPVNHLCPTHPEVRRFFGDLLNELLVGLPVSGILLSHFSFPPGSSNPDTATCFCKNCKNLVDREIAIDLDTIELDPQAKNFKRWTQWRIQKIDALVRSLKIRIRKTNPTSSSAYPSTADCKPTAPPTSHSSTGATGPPSDSSTSSHPSTCPKSPTTSGSTCPKTSNNSPTQQSCSPSSATYPPTANATSSA